MSKLSLFFFCGAFVLVAPGFGQNENAPKSACSQLIRLNLPSTIKQVLVVESQSGIQAQLSTCIWDQGWKLSLFTHPVAAVIGKNGLAIKNTKKEGDLKTPTGFYPLQWAFGTEPLALKMDFRFISVDDKFIDDPNDPLYNSWVDGPTSAHSYELMMHPLYKMGAVINYNMNPVKPGAGSAIFMHIWRSSKEGTAGCIALNETHLLQILHWLDKKQKPYIYIKQS